MHHVKYNDKLTECLAAAAWTAAAAAGFNIL